MGTDGGSVWVRQPLRSPQCSPVSHPPMNTRPAETTAMATKRSGVGSAMAAPRRVAALLEPDGATRRARPWLLTAGHRARVNAFPLSDSLQTGRRAAILGQARVPRGAELSLS